MAMQDPIGSFVKELAGFDYSLSVLDHVWTVRFPDASGDWQHLHVNRYRKTYYISHVNSDRRIPGLVLDPRNAPTLEDNRGFSEFQHDSDDEALERWRSLMTSATKWLRTTGRDWIKANKRVQLEYPLNCRWGIAPHCLVRESLPGIYRLDRELGKKRTRKFVRLVEDGFFMKEENSLNTVMTAADYFNYCKIAYLSGQREEDNVDESLSGRQMYERYADGRDEGLLEIDENCEQEFAAWLNHEHPKRSTGGHPWEIKRGGNTTNIQLQVCRPTGRFGGKFKVQLHGPAITRMAEVLNMLLGIHQAGLPITVSDPEGIRSRLLGLDNIGIVPAYETLHRAEQRFPKEQNVYDVMYFDDLGRYKRRISPFIRWEPLPILKPSDSHPRVRCQARMPDADAKSISVLDDNRIR